MTVAGLKHATTNTHECLCLSERRCIPWATLSMLWFTHTCHVNLLISDRRRARPAVASALSSFPAVISSPLFCPATIVSTIDKMEESASVHSRCHVRAFATPLSNPSPWSKTICMVRYTCTSNFVVQQMQQGSILAIRLIAACVLPCPETVVGVAVSFSQPAAGTSKVGFAKTPCTVQELLLHTMSDRVHLCLTLLRV